MKRKNYKIRTDLAIQNENAKLVGKDIKSNINIIYLHYLRLLFHDF